MEQKRFLSADEVFQLFGVDAEALEKLVETGEVQALPDLGTFKYRSEDFANLVKAGRLSPRTSGEMFLVDDDGDLPFLKLKKEDKAINFEEDVSFIELDEEALEEQAKISAQTKTPEVPDNWFGDDLDAESGGLATSREVPILDPKKRPGNQTTDFEIKSKVPGVTRSDSDVRLVDDDDSIVFDDPAALTGSDSDVRLEGPISSFRTSPAPEKKKPDSDSDVRIAKTPAAQTDSDVRIVPPVAEPVTDRGARDSDSDVILVGVPVDRSSSKPAAKKKDSDSDVRIAKPAADAPPAPPRASDPFVSMLAAAADSDIRLEDSDVRVEQGGQVPPQLENDMPQNLSRTDSDINLEPELAQSDDSGIALVDAGSDSGIRFVSPSDDIGVGVDSADSGIKLESSALGRGITLEPTAVDSGITLEPSGSGLRFESSDDSGISIIGADSGISLEDDDPNATVVDPDTVQEPVQKEGAATVKLDASYLADVDSTFGVSLSDESEHTMELAQPSDEELIASDDDVPAGKGVKSLSEAFQLEDSVEVEDLDISDDLATAMDEDYIDEVAMDDEVLDVSDEHFGSEEIAVAEEDVPVAKAAATPVKKQRPRPTEPSWGMVAIAPVICAAVFMMVTSTVLWGGIVTMWSGKDAPGPAGMLISTLAGMSPF